MFHWICPECGREIPPAVKECPACVPAAAPVAALRPEAEAEPAPDPMLALAEEIRAAQQAARPEESSAVTPAQLQESGSGAFAEPEKIEENPSLTAAAPADPEPASPVSAGGETDLSESSGEKPLPAVAAPVGPGENSERPHPEQPEEHAPAIAPFGETQAVALLAPPEHEQTAVLKPLAPPPDEAATKDAPPSGSWLQLAPLQRYAGAARAIRPAAPRGDILMPDSGPRMTLPGPALPPELNRLQEASIVTLIGGGRPAGRKLPGWLISLALMIAIPLAGAAVLFYFQPAHLSADTKPAQSEQSAPPAQSTAAQAPAAQPLAQTIEVTGFRFLMDYNKKSEIHYLVVNHTGADLADMTVFVTLRAANAKPGQPPLCRFSFRSPGLAPYESKEMTSPIEKLTRPVALPDWQDLRPEVQVTQ